MTRKWPFSWDVGQFALMIHSLRLIIPTTAPQVHLFMGTSAKCLMTKIRHSAPGFCSKIFYTYWECCNQEHSCLGCLEQAFFEFSRKKVLVRCFCRSYMYEEVLILASFQTPSSAITRMKHFDQFSRKKLFNFQGKHFSHELLTRNLGLFSISIYWFRI